MLKKSRRATPAPAATTNHRGRESRVANCGVLQSLSGLAAATGSAGVAGVLALAGATTVAGVVGVAIMSPTASASSVVGGCLAPQTNCAPGKSAAARTTADPGPVSFATGPQLAPLPPSPPVNSRSISAVPDRPVVAVNSVAGGGYRVVGTGGGVYSFGAPDTSNLLDQKLNGRIVGAGSSGSSLWLAGSDGGVFTLGGAPFYGSMGATHLNGSIVDIAVTPSGHGYYMVGRDGGIFTFGDAHFFGSMGSQKLNGAIVAMAVDPATGGYWLVGADGGIFAFNAPFLGSTGGTRLAGRMVGIAATPTGNGYYLVGSDGGIFTFGDAHYSGSTGGVHLGGTVVGVAATPSGNGYWIAASDGGIFTFGDAPFYGSAVAPPPPPPPPPVPVPPAEAPVAPTGLIVPSGSTGLDISRYQCGAIPSAHYAISVVQVTGGALNWPPNPCFAAEAAWAGSNLQTYIYMDGLPNPAPAEALVGPAGVCGSNGACLAYNYGWFWAHHWATFSGALGFHSRQWWLDVETGSGWTDPGTNDQVIRGALAALRASGAPYGIYSSPRQWGLITGGWNVPGVQIWVPGAGNVSGPGYTATNFCGDPGERFAGGVLRYVQDGYGGAFPGAYNGPASRYDTDYAC
jgi:hypothetical protein